MMDKKTALLKGKLIVSCQALPDEPLHSSFIMSKMALAAKQGDAAGIRANTKEDILEIKKEVDLPIIGIVKKNYGDNPVYITPTMAEVDELVKAGADIIAMDVTSEIRPDQLSLEKFFENVKNKYPGQLLMADCSTIEEAVSADRLGFDFIGTTLVGYTKQSKNSKIEENDFAILRKILEQVSHPVIAEGNINTPEKARRVIELGAFYNLVSVMKSRL